MPDSRCVTHHSRPREGGLVLRVHPQGYSPAICTRRSKNDPEARCCCLKIWKWNTSFKQTVLLAVLKFIVPIEKTKVFGAVSSAEALPPHIVFFLLRLVEECWTGMRALNYWDKIQKEVAVKVALEQSENCTSVSSGIYSGGLNETLSACLYDYAPVEYEIPTWRVGLVVLVNVNVAMYLLCFTG